MEKEIRRYKSGEHFLYDQQFEVLQRKSSILNPIVREKTFTPIDNLNWLMETFEVKDHDLVIIDRTLNGVFDESGRILESGIRWPIQMIERQRLNRGDTLEQAKEGAKSQYFSEKALRLEAQYDVLKNELAQLKRWIEVAEQKQENARRPCLPKGPRGNRTGVYPRCFVDGQKTEKDAKTGELYINDERSPYNGMKMSDYIEMAHNFNVSLPRKTTNIPRDKWPKIPEGVKLIDK